MKRRIDSLHKPQWLGDNYKDYYDLINNNKEKLLQFVNYITINVSEFFRNPAQWETLEKNILPHILEKYKKN